MNTSTGVGREGDRDPRLCVDKQIAYTTMRVLKRAGGMDEEKWMQSKRMISL